MNDVLYNLAGLADAAVPPLRLLAEDPERDRFRSLAADAIDTLVVAIDPIVTKSDLMLSSIPPCPVGGLTAWAIRGGRQVTRTEAMQWARELDVWASAVDRIAA